MAWLISGEAGDQTVCKPSSPVSSDCTTLLLFPPLLLSPFILRMELRSIRVMSWWHFFKHFPSPYTKLLWKTVLLTITTCLILKEPLFFSKQPQNQWTWNHVLALSLIRHSCATFPVLLNVRFHPGQLGDLVLTKIVMTSKAKKVCNIKMACLKLPSNWVKPWIINKCCSVFLWSFVCSIFQNG